MLIEVFPERKKMHVMSKAKKTSDQFCKNNHKHQGRRSDGGRWRRRMGGCDIYDQWNNLV